MNYFRKFILLLCLLLGVPAEAVTTRLVRKWKLTPTTEH